MIAIDSSHARSRRAVVGAACGALAMGAFITSGLVWAVGEHSQLALIAGTLVGAVLGWLDLQRFAGWVAAALALVVLVVGLTPLVPTLAGRWVRRDAVPAEPLDAIVVLSSGVMTSGVLDEEGLNRLIGGLRLSRQNHARRLVTTRVVLGENPPVSTEGEQRALIAMAGDTTRWSIVGPVASTHDEAGETARLLGGTRARIAVVTSEMHSRRACALFETTGFTVACVPTDGRRYSIDDLSSPEPRFAAFVDYLYERLAMVKYRSRGWIR